MRLLAPIVAFLALAVGMASAGEEPAAGQVVFVCEHGNVKSLMAASYFNQLAASRGLRLRAISRGSAPDSNSVPAPIVAGLHTDGVDVSDFRPAKSIVPRQGQTFEWKGFRRNGPEAIVRPRATTEDA